MSEIEKAMDDKYLSEIRQRYFSELTTDDYKQFRIADIARMRLDMKRLLADYDRINNFTESQCAKLLVENEQLQKELAALREANRWIPVEKKLPELNKIVLVFNHIGEVDMAYISDTLDWEGAFCDYTEASISHWRPLPEAPEGGEG